MLKLILGGVIGVGVLLIGFSSLHNVFLLFLGLGLVSSAVITWILKKHSRFLLLPFILLLTVGLFLLNRIDFQANSFSIDFIDSQGYTAFLNYSDQENPLEEEEIPELSADADLDLKQTATIKFVFEPQPTFSRSDLTLEDYFKGENDTRAVWLWSADRPDFITNQGTKQEDTTQDGERTSVTILETLRDPTIESYEILVNEESIAAGRIEDNLYYYMESFNKFFPFYSWSGDEISTAFDVFNGKVILENDLCYFYPDGLRPALQLKGSPASISSQGLFNFGTIILTFTTVYTVILLGIFTALSVLLDKYPHNIKRWFNHIKKSIQGIREKAVFDRELKGVTPVKVLWFTTIIIGLILVFQAVISTGEIKLLQIILIFLSLISFFYIFKGNGSRK